MENKAVNHLLGQNEKAKDLGCSISTLQRHRQDINMLSPYRILSNSYRRREKTSNEDLIKRQTISNHPKCPQKTSTDLKEPQNTPKDGTQ